MGRSGSHKVLSAPRVHMIGSLNTHSALTGFSNANMFVFPEGSHAATAIEFPTFTLIEGTSSKQRHRVSQYGGLILSHISQRTYKTATFCLSCRMSPDEGATWSILTAWSDENQPPLRLCSTCRRPERRSHGNGKSTLLRRS